MSTPALPPEDEVRALVAAVIADVISAEPPTEPLAADPGRRRWGSPPPGIDATAGRADIAVGADHGGYVLKEKIAAALREGGVDVRDCGTDSADAVDYPDFAHAVARLVADGACRFGIVVDGAGIGSCIAANKVPGVRAATCWDVTSAKNSREHNLANVLVLGAGMLGERLALEIVDAWLGTPWGGDRHARRVEKITEIERRYLAAREGVAA
ncbi:MAG: ribose 5-phosphate isomerase B [Verrucomicrobiota bacterium]